MSDDTVSKSSRRRKNRSENEEAEAQQMTEEERALTERKGRATPSARKRREGPEEKSGSFFSRLFGRIGGYITEVRDELDKVVWPDKDELWRLSRIVTAVVIFSAAILGFIGYIYNKIFVIGFGDNNHDGFPAIFVILFVVVVAAYIVVSRKLSNNVTQ